MNKRKASGSDEECEPKAEKKSHDDKVEFFESTKSLKEIAGFKVSLSLWYHFNLRRFVALCTNHPEFDFDSSDRDSDGFSDSDTSSHIFPFSDSDDTSDMESAMDSENGTFSSSDMSGSGSDAVRDIIFGFPYRSEDKERARFFRKIESSISKLHVPKKIKKYVRFFADDILKELCRWVTYIDNRILRPHHLRYMFESSYKLSFYFVDDIFWHSNGFIDHLATAKNMLLSPYLSDAQKYLIICEYCMEDEMEKLPRLLITGRYANQMRRDERNRPLFKYWSSRLQNKVMKFDVERYPSYESYLIERINLDNWSAVKYLFTRLDYESQIVKAKYIIQRHGIKHRKNVLSLLNDTQQQLVFMDFAKKIMMNFIKHFFYDHALAVWYRCKHIITEVEFIDLMKCLARKMRYCYSESQHNSFAMLAIDMWIHASDQTKKNVLEENNGIVSKLINSERKFCSSLGKLLMMMLSKASAEVKKRIFDTHVMSGKFPVQVLKRNGADFLNQFLELRFNDSEISDFKLKTMYSSDIQKHCMKLIRCKNSGRLNDLLNFLTDTERKKYKNTLLNSEEMKDFFVSDLFTNESERAVKFVNDIVPDSNELRVFYKTTFTSDQAISRLFSKLRNGKLDEVKELLNKLFDTEDQKEVKLLLLKELKSESVSNQCVYLHKFNLNEFFTWCMSNQELIEFKNSLPFDDIFDNLLKNSLIIRDHLSSSEHKFKALITFKHINHFLNWYFPNENDIKVYKIKKIFEFREIHIITELLGKNVVNWQSCLKKVMNWFFDNDQDQIARFKSKYSRLRISQYI